MMSIPTILSTKKVFDFRSLNDENGKPLRHGIYMHDRVFQNNDHQGHWTFASRNENPSLTAVKANAVVIVARVGNKILIADEYRVPLAGREYGFPAGLCENGQSFEENAVRELREESGLHAVCVYPQLTTGVLVSSAGLSDEAVKIVFMEAEGVVSHHLCEPSESIHAELMDYSKVMDVFHNKNILQSAKTWGIMWGWWINGYIAFAPSFYPFDPVFINWTNKNTDQESFTV